MNLNVKVEIIILTYKTKLGTFSGLWVEIWMHLYQVTGIIMTTLLMIVLWIELITTMQNFTKKNRRGEGGSNV